MGQPDDGCLVDAGLHQLRDEHVGEMGVGQRFAAAGLGRIVPAAVVAEQKLVAEAGVEDVVDQVDVPVVLGIADGIELDPGAAAGDGEVQRAVRLKLGVDGDETRRVVAGGLDDVELVHDDPALDRVAADDGIGLTRRRGSGAQDARLEIGDALVAGAELDPAGTHARLLDLVGQLGQHPVAQGFLAGLRHPLRDPRFAVVAGGHDDRQAGGLGDRAVDIGPPSHPAGRALDESRDPARLDALDLGRHQAHDIGRIGLGVARLGGRAQVDEDVLVRQDHAQLIARPGPERGVEFWHRKCR